MITNNNDQAEDKLDDVFFMPPSLPTKIIKKVLINRIVNEVIKKRYAEILKENTKPKESINVYIKLLV